MDTVKEIMDAPIVDGWHVLPDGRSVTLGDGVVLGSGVVLGDSAKLGDGVVLGNYVVLGDYVTLGNDVELGNDVTLGNGVWLGDNVELGDDVELGCGVRLGCGVKLGDGARLGNDVKLGDGARLGNDVWLGCDVRLGNDVWLGNYVDLAAEVNRVTRRLDRLDTWWVSIEGGPATTMTCRRLNGFYWECDRFVAGNPCGSMCLSDKDITKHWLPVPPRLVAAPGKVFRQCRLPKKGERYATAFAGGWLIAADDWVGGEDPKDIYGGRRWIAEDVATEQPQCIGGCGEDRHAGPCPAKPVQMNGVRIHADINEAGVKAIQAAMERSEPGRWEHLSGGVKCNTWDFYKSGVPMDYLRVYDSTPDDRAKILAAFDPDRVSIPKAEHDALKDKTNGK